MELRHLRYFVAVAEEMNIHRAAEKLNVSQPPVTVTIKQLEEELGVTLFHREGRGIQITRAGKDFLAQAQRILKNVKVASLQAKNIEQGRQGVLRIGFISSAITGILQNIVSDYRRLYPQVEIQVEQSIADRIADDILKEDYDVGIIRTPMYLSQELFMTQVTKESWVAAIHKKHDLAGKNSIHLTDLNKEDLIFYPRWNGPAGYDDVMAFFREQGLEPNIVQEAPEQMTIAGLVASNIGIGIVPECMSLIKLKNVVHRPIDGTQDKTGFALIYKHKNDVLINQFIDLAKQIKS